MTKRKIYEVSFYFDLHAVTSPGVWLCPKGKVAVRVSLFGVSEITKLLPPVFPLLFHERFHFQKVFRKAGSLPVLERKLSRLPVCLQLLQYPEGTTKVVKLAVFKACLGDLLFPTAGADCNLMFCTTKCYPGIIAPMAEVTTKLSLIECDVDDGTSNTLPVTVLSKGIREQSKDRPIRQKAVCHTKHNLYCGCFRNGTTVENKRRKGLPVNRRRNSADWERKVTSVKPGSAAHYISHKNNDDDFPKYDIRNARSDSSFEPAHIFKSSNEINMSHARSFVQNAKSKEHDYQSEQYLPFTRAKGIHEREYPGPERYSEKERTYHSSKYDHEETSHPYSQGHSGNERRTSDSSRDHEGRTRFFTENDHEDQTKEAFDEHEMINELKREIRMLLEEQDTHQAKACHGKNKYGVSICCLCCPKERMLQENLAYDGKHKNRANREHTPCSECFLAACRQAHEATQDPDILTLKEDIQKRPLFYSNLHAAYERLKNKKNKKTVWR